MIVQRREPTVKFDVKKYLRLNGEIYAFCDFAPKAGADLARANRSEC